MSPQLAKTDQYLSVVYIAHCNFACAATRHCGKGSALVQDLYAPHGPRTFTMIILQRQIGWIQCVLSVALERLTELPMLDISLVAEAARRFAG